MESPLERDAVDDAQLGFADQFGLWASLAVTLTIPAAAVFVVNPLGDVALGFAAVATAVLLGVITGSFLLGAVALAGFRSARPTMSMLRGVLGDRAAWIPTVLNIAQCVGWAAIEVVVMTEVATSLTSDGLRPLWALISGGLALAMALKPLPAIKLVRKYLVALVAVATLVLVIGMLRNGVAATDTGSWHGFWPSFDIVLSLPISWAPLVADYSRHARSGRSAFLGTALGFASAGMVYFLMGALAVFTISGAADAYTATDFIPALLAVPAGAIALVILLLDEVDEAFANIYSTAVSVQNLAPRASRGAVATGVALVATGAALALDLLSYESFLFAIGAIFVPLTGVIVVWVFGVHRGNYDQSSATAWLFLPWLSGLIAYQLLAPGYVPVWSDAWVSLREALGISTVTTSASLVSLTVAAAGTYLVGAARKRSRA